jgi:hypothetical protein
VIKTQETGSMKATPEAIAEGSHVHLLSHGRHIGSGVIDAWMPDGTAFWIWLDHGAGKRLVHESDAVDVLISTTDPDKVPDR